MKIYQQIMFSSFLKKLSVLITFSTWSATGFSQGNFEWIHHHGDDNHFHTEKAMDIQTDRWGNVYVAGQVNDLWVRDSSGNTIKTKTNPNLDSLYNYGGKDVWLAKYSRAGKLLWHRYAGSGANDYYFDMVADNDGNCYVTGRLLDHNTRKARSIGGVAISNDSLGVFIAKVDSGGNLLWHTSFGGDTINGTNYLSYLANPYNLHLDTKKNEILCFFQGGGDTPLGFQKLFDKDSIHTGIHEARFDLNGNYLGVKSFPFPSYNHLPLVSNVHASEYGRFITGDINKDTIFVAGDTLLRQIITNAVSIGFDTSLNHLWSFSTSNYYDSFRDSKVIGDTLLASGHFNLSQNPTVYFDTISHTGNPNVSQGCGLFVFNATSGKLLGLYPSKGNGHAANAHIAATGFNEKFMGIGGSFRKKLTFSGTNDYMEVVQKCANCNTSELFFAVHDRSGNFIVEDLIYSSGVDNNAVLTMHFQDSMLYIGGFLGDTALIPGVDTFRTRGALDAFVAAYRLPYTTSLPENGSYIKANNGILAYPNPTNGRVNLMGKAVGREGRLYNLSGQWVKSYRLDKNEFRQEISLEQLESGIYFLVIVGENESQELKIVKTE